MSQIVHYIGLDVHKESIAAAIAPANTMEVRHDGIIRGTLDGVDELLKKLSQPGIELRLVYEAARAALSLPATSKAKAFIAMWSAPRSPPRKPPAG
jgi:transposase